MVGTNIGGAGGAAIAIFLFPLAFALFFAWTIWPVTFAYLVIHSPHKNKIKWWIFMPLASLAASIVGSVKAGFLFWIPAVVGIYVYGAPAEEWTKTNFLLVGMGAATAVLFSTKWILKVDEKLHDGS